MLAPTEIRALVNILDDLDYYALLSVERSAPASQVRHAYHATCRRFHPDLCRQLEPELRAGVSRIARRVAEAYSVLRDPKRRQIYDQQLARGASGLRLQLAEATLQAERKALEARLGSTPNGRRFFALAHQELDRGNLDAAARNLKMALTFEPSNACFQQKLDEVRRLLR